MQSVISGLILKRGTDAYKRQGLGRGRGPLKAWHIRTVLSERSEKTLARRTVASWPWCRAGKLYTGKQSDQKCNKVHGRFAGARMTKGEGFLYARGKGRWRS